MGTLSNFLSRFGIGKSSTSPTNTRLQTDQITRTNGGEGQFNSWMTSFANGIGIQNFLRNFEDGTGTATAIPASYSAISSVPMATKWGTGSIKKESATELKDVTDDDTFSSIINYADAGLPGLASSVVNNIIYKDKSLQNNINSYGGYLSEDKTVPLYSTSVADYVRRINSMFSVSKSSTNGESGVKTQSTLNKVIKSASNNFDNTASSIISKSAENQAVFNKVGNNSFEIAMANAKATGRIGSVANTLQSIGYSVPAAPTPNTVQISYNPAPVVNNTQVQKSYSRSSNIADKMNSAAARMGSTIRW